MVEYCGICGGCVGLSFCAREQVCEASQRDPPTDRPADRPTDTPTDRPTNQPTYTDRTHLLAIWHVSLVYSSSWQPCSSKRSRKYVRQNRVSHHHNPCARSTGMRNVRLLWVYCVCSRILVPTAPVCQIKGERVRGCPGKYAQPFCALMAFATVNRSEELRNNVAHHRCQDAEPIARSPQACHKRRVVLCGYCHIRERDT